MGVFRLFLMLLAMLPAGLQVHAQTSTACEALAGALGDRPVVEELEAARTACAGAVHAEPGSAQVLHLYAGTLELSGEIEAAGRLYQWAADDGYDPAVRALARLAGEPMPDDDPAGRSATQTAAADTGHRDDPIAAQAAALGADPEALVAWAAAEIAREAYAGAMRGAAGTLSARAGSAADTALLLHALIRAADPTAELRFAQCTLPPVEVDALLAAALAARPPRPRPLIELAAMVAQEADDPEFRQVALGLAGLWDEATATVERQADRIIAALAEVDYAGPPPTASIEAMREALATHVWLQWRRDDAWLDLDATTGAPGRARCPVQTATPTLPASMHHRLEARVVVEERLADGFSSRVVLEHVWDAAALADTGLLLMMAETTGRDALVPARPAPPAGFLAYTPLLRAGDTEIVGDSFTMPAPQSWQPPSGGVGGLGSAILGGFALSEPPPEEDAPRPEGDVAAVWLELTMTAPDGGRETLTRPLFDRIGYAARAHGEQATHPLAALSEVDGEYQALATIWSIAVWTGGSPAVLPTHADDELDSLLTGLTQVHRGYDILRQALYGAAAGAAPRFARFGPDVSLLGWVPTTDLSGSEGVDIVMDVLSDRAMALPGSDVNAPASVAAWAVSSVMAERILAGLDRTIPPLFGDTDVPGFTPIDAAAVFDAAHESDVALRWVTQDDLQAPGIAGSEEALARIGDHLADGRMLLVPQHEVRIGSTTLLAWWMIDPATGAIRDQLENGRHGQLTEYPQTGEPARRATPAIRGYRQCIVQRLIAAAGAVTLALSMGGDPANLYVASQFAGGSSEMQQVQDGYRRARDPLGGSGRCRGGQRPL